MPLAPRRQVDLSLEPGRRDEMVAVSNTRTLPQLHVDGVSLGDFEAIQEMEDAGELGKRLRGEQ
jgi:glutaredoxin-related protein